MSKKRKKKQRDRLSTKSHPKNKKENVTVILRRGHTETTVCLPQLPQPGSIFLITLDNIDQVTATTCMFLDQDLVVETVVKREESPPIVNLL